MSDKDDKKQNNQQDDLEEFSEESDEVQLELDKVRAEYQDLENRFKRALADYQNLEKRVSEGRAEMAAWATSNLLQRIVPVMDHFDKAMAGVSEDEKKSGWFKGVAMSVQQLAQVLKDEGLEQIEADGQFDPALHEAVDTRDGENDKILEVVEKGYMLNGKVLKPARVVVGKK